MVVLLRMVRSVLGIPRRFRRLITPQKSSKDYKFRVAFKPMRQGVSQEVLDAADRTIQKYKADLDYLKDR